MAATVLLAIFAFAAWRSSQSNLRTLERQMVDNKMTAQNSIDATSLLATESRQRVLLVDYCTALMSLAMSLPLREMSRQEELDDIMNRNLATSIAWLSWAMELHATDPIFRSLTAAWDEALRVELTRKRLRELDIETNALESLLTAEGQALDISEITGFYLRQLENWQVAPSRRQEIFDDISQRKEKYIA